MARYTGPKTKIIQVQKRRLLVSSVNPSSVPTSTSKREIILLECMAPTAEERKFRNMAPS